MGEHAASSSTPVSTRTTSVAHRRSLLRRRSRLCIGRSPDQARCRRRWRNHGQIRTGTGRVLRYGPWGAHVRPCRDSARPRDLSSREREVASLIAAGKSNREIATALVLSECTAQNHVQHILTELGFTESSQIAVRVSKNPGH
ncbi:LuxR C-terminal-related transcriptional regulator [Nocardia sp. NPDC049707]|uniref:helix-turn-helix transcriptional regulator n=1 Tax=Nocardia sp. NPDC049707 TaxID=3154735 RepID=UPI003433C2E2